MKQLTGVKRMRPLRGDETRSDKARAKTVNRRKARAAKKLARSS